MKIVYVISQRKGINCIFIGDRKNHAEGPPTVQGFPIRTVDTKVGI